MEPARTPGAVAGTVGGRYAIEGLLAAGGMGEVYRARDTVLDRTVALKVIRGGLTADPAFVDRFRSEATNAARLSHPNIVQVYDFGRDGDLAYMAMEYVEGRTLRALLGQRGRLAQDAATFIAARVCSALESARRAGIVHRDVKPENVLVADDGRVKVADFGLSRAFAEARATQAGFVFGTAAYLAPEQAEGRPGDHRSDLYALGVVLFEMLTGRLPFTADTAAGVAYRRLTEDVPRPSTLEPSVPPAVDAVVRRATARDPEERFPTAAAMAAALGAPGAPPHEIEAHHTSAIPMDALETIAVPSSRRRRRGPVRRRRLAVLLALLLVAIAVPVGTRLLGTKRIPSVRGMTQEQAKAALERDGFTADPVVRNHPTVAAGRVISQRPASGASARRGARVEIVISLGPELVVLPDVLGISFGTAKRSLEGRGFVVVRRDVFSETVTAGKVAAQDPEPNLRLERGTEVTLSVSKGVEVVVVPDVTGKAEKAARQHLEGAGLTVTVTRAFDDAAPDGSVVSQSPKGGAKARKGSAVALVVSRGAPPIPVPNLRCMTRRQAEDALVAKGFRADFSGSGRRVIDQEPAPGSRAPRGSVVRAFLGTGVYCR
jgi:serine/threonine-protein kinase